MIRRVAPFLVIAILLGSGLAVYLLDEEPQSSLPTFSKVEACDVPLPLLERVIRGYHRGRSGDILTIEQPKVQPENTRHSTPYPYTQDVPIVLYGPGFIRSKIDVSRDVTVADLAPTYAELLGFEFPDVDGSVLEEALLPPKERNGVPRLIITVVWDGAGDNVLREWPDVWPQLRKVISKGAIFQKATVGSSPSITPSIHATIGTGTFPASHGITDISMRAGDQIIDPFEGGTSRYLRDMTLADLWDPSTGNKAKVGLMARESWHLGMIGHGSYIRGGDKDIAVIDRLDTVEFHGFPDFTIPSYVYGNEGLAEEVAELDRRDGSEDGRWRGEELDPTLTDIRTTPAWPPYQTSVLLKLLRNERFGADEVADLFYVNYKTTDLGGHKWTMVEPEVRDGLEAQDEELGVLIEELDELVGRNNYVLAVTADHGMTPPADSRHNYMMDEHSIKNDIQAEFDNTNPDVELVPANRGYQIFLDRDEMRANDVTIQEIVDYLRDYTIGDNAPTDEWINEEMDAYRDEPMFYAVLTPKQLRAAVDCARRTQEGEAAAGLG